MKKILKNIKKEIAEISQQLDNYIKYLKKLGRLV